VISFIDNSPVTIGTGANNSRLQRRLEALRRVAQLAFDVIAGQAPAMLDALPPLTEFPRVAKVRALVVTTATRLEMLPDVPDIGSFMPGHEASARPKNRGPDQRAPVIFRATTERER
jgi:hypothetical protein